MSGSDSNDELRAKIRRLAAEVSAKQCTQGIAEQVNILAASNDDTAAFLAALNKQPGGPRDGAQLPSARDTTLSGPLHHRSSSVAVNKDGEFHQAHASPTMHHRPSGLTEEALEYHNAVGNSKFDTSYQPAVVELAPEHRLNLRKVHPLRRGRQTGFVYHAGKLPTGLYTRDPTFELGLCEVAFGGKECPRGAECDWRHSKLTETELAQPGFHGKGRNVVTRSYCPQKFERTAWNDLE